MKNIGRWDLSGPAPKTWEIKLTITVTDNWVADGFDMGKFAREGRLAQVIEEQMCGYMYESEREIKAEVLKEPPQALLKMAMGAAPERPSKHREFNVKPALPIKKAA